MKDTDSPAATPDPEATWQAVRAELSEETIAALGPKRLAEFETLLKLAAKQGAKPGGPVREVQSLVGDRWCGLLLPLLRYGPLRFSTLQRIVDLTDHESISRRMLSFKLRALERDGFVQRVEIPGATKRVEYSLTGLGHEFYPAFIQLIDWLTVNAARIEAARVCFEKSDQGTDQ
jgi:DNA-binding HxlR family transcriptional regulator